MTIKAAVFREWIGNKTCVLLIDEVNNSFNPLEEGSAPSEL